MALMLKTAACLLLPLMALSSHVEAEEPSPILGQGAFRYKIVEGWGREALDQVNVKNGHALALDAAGRLFFLTDDARNNVVILDPNSGALIQHWTARMPGAHGMSLVTEGGREVLYITDTALHEVRKLTLDGQELARYPWPEKSGLYPSAAEYRPSKTLHHPDGRFWVFDGYGKDYVHAYGSDGTWLRSWGGKLGAEEDQLVHWGPHGGALDLEFGEGAPLILIAMSDQQYLKRFTLEGRYVDTFPFPGGNPRDVVIRAGHAFIPHLGDNWPKDKNAPGFISVLDRDFRIVSNIGAPAAQYDGDGRLQPMRSDGRTFIHPHAVAVDEAGNLFVAQFASPSAPLLKLERLPAKN